MVLQCYVMWLNFKESTHPNHHIPIDWCWRVAMLGKLEKHCPDYSHDGHWVQCCWPFILPTSNRLPFQFFKLTAGSFTYWIFTCWPWLFLIECNKNSHISVVFCYKFGLISLFNCQNCSSHPKYLCFQMVIVFLTPKASSKMRLISSFLSLKLIQDLSKPKSVIQPWNQSEAMVNPFHSSLLSKSENVIQGLSRWGNRGERMHQYLVEEHLGSDGKVSKKFRLIWNKWLHKCKPKGPPTKRPRLEVDPEGEESATDNDYTTHLQDDSSDESSCDEGELLMNTEACAKCVPIIF